jgi:hypothetical protein
MSRDGKQNHECSGKDASTELKEPRVLPPETVEDFLLIALEKVGVAEIVRILRDWCGSKEVRRALNNLPHRDPVDRFTHISRLAVELYAKKHDITPATLMAELTGINYRKDAKGSERYKLRKAREHLENDRDANFCAHALAEHWEETRKGQDAVKHLKVVAPEV